MHIFSGTKKEISKLQRKKNEAENIFHTLIFGTLGRGYVETICFKNLNSPDSPQLQR